MYYLSKYSAGSIQVISYLGVWPNKSACIFPVSAHVDEVFGPVLIAVYRGGARSQWIRRGLVWRAEQETIEGWTSWCSTQETIGRTSWWFNSIVFSFFSFCHSFSLLVFKYRCLFLELILFWSFLSSSFLLQAPILSFPLSLNTLSSSFLTPIVFLSLFSYAIHIVHIFYMNYANSVECCCHFQWI